MAKLTPHPFDEAAEELVHYLDTEAAYFAEALRGGHAAPFSAEASEKDKLAFFRRKMFMENTDGSPNYDAPNTAGREELVNQYGIKVYSEQIAPIVMGRRNMPDQPLADEEDELEPGYESEGSY